MNKFLDKLIKTSANPYWLAIYRIGFGLFLIYYWIKFAEVMPLVWYGHSERTVAFINVVRHLWLVAIFVWTLGIGGRVTSVIQHVLLMLTLGKGRTLGLSAQEDLLMLISFWSMFLKLDGVWSLEAWLRKRKSPEAPVPLQPVWPVFMLGFNAGLLFFSAGVFKWLDPLWQQGNGFYYFYMQPWIKQDWTSPMLDQRWLMVLINHATIVLEVGLLVFLFERLRWVAALATFVFFGGLIFPASLGLIGFVGQFYGILFLSMTKLPGFLEKRLPPQLHYNPVTVPANPRLEKAVAPLLVFFMVLSLYSFSKPMLKRLVLPPSVVESALWKNTADHPLLEKLTFYTVRELSGELFTKVHIIGGVAYRLQSKLDDGTLLEPFAMFKPDKTCYPGMHYYPRFPGIVAYRVANFYHKLSIKPGYMLTSGDKRQLRGLVNLEYSHLTPEQKQRLREITVLVSAIPMPLDYEGNVRPWEKEPWVPLYTCSTSNQKLMLDEEHCRWSGIRPRPVNRQSRVPGLANYF